MDIVSFALYLAVSIIFLLVGMKIPLVLIFSLITGFAGAVQLTVDAAITIPIGACVGNATQVNCSSNNITVDPTAAIILLSIVTIFSGIIFIAKMRGTI